FKNQRIWRNTLASIGIAILAVKWFYMGDLGGWIDIVIAPLTIFFTVSAYFADRYMGTTMKEVSDFNLKGRMKNREMMIAESPNDADLGLSQLGLDKLVDRTRKAMNSGQDKMPLMH